MNININKEIMQGFTIPFAIILILGMIIIPLPPLALDLLFITNIVISLSVLMACVFAKKPLEFSIFPTVLLLATMLRLSLNIASTRVILLRGHGGSGASGQIIESFGNFVIGGNFVVGIIVFIILTIINFVVVTKGTERVSEVSARFTLDAMPGKQMAIDADLNSGAITQEEATERRSELSQESQFYGSMDGASKFVKGDAIAGILILLINIIGGITVGAAQKGMSLAEASETYLLLSIGDGLVAILPSIIMALATAIISTKVSNNTELSEMLKVQFGTNHMIPSMAGTIVCIVGLIPAMPNLLFLSIGGGLLFLGDKIKRITEQRNRDEAEVQRSSSESPAQKKIGVSIEDIQEHDTIMLVVGSGLTDLVKSETTPLIQSITGERIELSKAYGVLIEAPRVNYNFELNPNEYKIYIKGLPCGGGEVYSNLLLAIGEADQPPLDGISAKDPVLGFDGYWIMDSMTSEAEEKGYEVLEPSQIISTHLSITIQKHLDAMVDTDSVQRMVQQLENRKPKLVASAIKGDQSLVTLLGILKSLLHERVPVTQLPMILEAFAELQSFNGITSAGYLSEVRKKLMPWIIENILKESEDKSSLKVVTMSQETQTTLAQTRSPDGSLFIAPDMLKSLTENLRKVNEYLSDMQYPLVLVVDGTLRSGLYDQLHLVFPDIHILGANEIGAYTAIDIAHVIS
ncbi:flagellar biosynthesis protein FlhA [Photobacterium galatheae]|uniref:Flagellar biosynthesis protein FlhA n=1 Tax=Photobacterium galatheae TaxID=1654360 RepID=A0A066RT45_9GAMM|nr:flagellar biosynthesis protein FlhA [Photobacterium galatheae]KDM90867.1 hypothetical protein EA58_13990 [Photobacterium galatheae]MCM0149165.1 FHIPEP family type III secretion protein [Photobacterium galatheae]